MGRSVYNSTTGTWQPVARVIINGVGNIAIEVTCDSEFAGLVITATDNTTTYTQICPSTSPYKVYFEGVTPGTWTISCELDGDEYTTEAIVQDVSCALRYGFNWQEWIDTSRDLDSSDYNTIDELLADEAAVRELCLEHATVDYLASITYSDEIVEKIINNDIFAKWVNLCDYALDFLYANQIIAGLMDTADKYGYGEWALMPQVPKMTSDTAPLGEAISSSAKSNYPNYYAFNNIVNYSPSVTSDLWASTTTTNSWIGYDFKSPTIIKHVRLVPDYSSGLCAKDISIDGYDGNDWVTIKSLTLPNDTEIKDYYIDLDNETAYTKYRVFIFNQYSTAANVCNALRELQFYAYAPKGNVPIMTSDTAPFGSVIGSGATSGKERYKAFNGQTPDTGSNVYETQTAPSSTYIGYKFVNPICVKKVSYVSPFGYQSGAFGIKTFVVKGSNDGSNWETLTDTINVVSQSTAEPTIANIDNDNYYLYYALFALDNWGTAKNYTQAGEIQFYGRELKVSVPVMTSNTAPFGEVSMTAAASNQHEAWYAFDNDDSTYAAGSLNTNIGVSYDFINKVIIKAVKIYSTDNRIGSFKVQGSNDGSDWTDLFSGSISSATETYFSEINNETEYRYYRLYALTAGSGQTGFIRFYTIQFYGIDYSEKEFEVGTTKKWLYDHGVELEPMTTVVTGSSTAEKRDSSIYVYQSNGGGIALTENTIDITDFDLMRVEYEPIYASTGTTYAILALSTVGNTTPSEQQRIAYSNLQTLNKYTGAVNVSSVNQSLYCILYRALSSGSTKFELKELWLE